MLLFFAALAMVTAADQRLVRAAPLEPTETLATSPKSAGQGVAVLGSDAVRDEAFTLARAVYGSSLRPRKLDELRARILAGDPAPPSATKDIRELAELRAGVTGEDAASRRLLASIAQQLGVQALLVVSRTPAPPAPKETKESETKDESAPVTVDGGAASVAPSVEANAGVTSPAVQTPAAGPRALVSARLFLADTGEFDAARYEPNESGWRGTVTSLTGRFPPPAPPVAAQAQLHVAPPKLPSEGKESRPFYMSPWLWGAVGAAALVGGFFFFAAQDTSNDPIHLQMRVPR